MANTEDLGKKLNELLERNYDSEKGYLKAAENVKDTDVKAFFKIRAKERYDFGHELKTEIKKSGATPNKGTSVAADIHHSWMDLKSALSSNEEGAILKETIRGDRMAIENYNEVLKETNIPPATEEILIKQRDAIKAALEQAKTIKKVES